MGISLPLFSFCVFCFFGTIDFGVDVFFLLIYCLVQGWFLEIYLVCEVIVFVVYLEILPFREETCV